MYREARAESLKRDKHQCQFPGCKKKRSLQSHHIRRYADYPILAHSAKNLITLCYDCHKRVTGHEDDYVGLFFSILASKLNDTSNN